MQISKDLTVVKSNSCGVNKIVIRYYDTNIVLIETIPSNNKNSRLITINTGSYSSAWRGINRALWFYDIPLTLYQISNTWYIKNLTTGKIYNYSDNMELAA